MTFYRNDYLIDRIVMSVFTTEQNQLAKLTGKRFSKAEAQQILTRIIDHKWYMSERLQRDIGLRVAAIDFVENIYEPTSQKNLNDIQTSKLGKLIRSYFVSKGNYISA